MKAWIERNQRQKGATYSTVWLDESGRRGRRTFKLRHEALDLKDRILTGSILPAEITSPPRPQKIPRASVPGVPRKPKAHNKELSNWSEFIEDFWSVCSVENSRSTLRRYRLIVRHFEEACSPKRLVDIDRQLALKFRAEALARKRGQRTLTRSAVNLEIKVMRRVMNHAVSLGLIQDNPFNGLKRLKETDGLAKMLVAVLALVILSLRLDLR